MKMKTSLTSEEINHIEKMKKAKNLIECHSFYPKNDLDCLNNMVLSLAEKFKPDFDYHYKLNDVWNMDMKEIISYLLQVVKRKIMSLPYKECLITNEQNIFCSEYKLELSYLFMKANNFSNFDVSWLNMVPNVQFVEMLVDFIDNNLYKGSLRRRISKMIVDVDRKNVL